MPAPADPAVVLGLSFGFHDAAAAVLVDGELVSAAEEERFTRRKHDSSLPENAAKSCLDLAGVDAGDVSHVVFYEKPLLVASRYLAVRQREGFRSLRRFVRDGPDVFGRNLLAGYRVASMLGRLGAPSPPPLRYVGHHVSHAASAYFPSPFEDAAVLTVDGIGEWATASIGVGSRRRLTMLEELRYPDSLGLVYSFVTAFCGFRPNDEEYKLMGLAPYGTAKYLDELRNLVELHEDGSFSVDARSLRWFDPSAFGSARLAARFGGPARVHDEPVGEREADLAASVQRLTEEVMLALAHRAHRLTGSPNLCLAGGVALNCVANGRLVREGPFEQIWVQPAAGDAGGAVGAAYALWHLELGHDRRVDDGSDSMSGGALGPSIDRAELQQTLDDRGIAYRVVDDLAERARIVAERIAAGAVVGWVQGRMEFGPRALGHRSLLADPRDPAVRERLNRIVKGREDFRPFAPAVLADRAADWFELDQPSPYMLVVADVRGDRLLDVGDEPNDLVARGALARSQIPACTHVDGSARIQTVARGDHPELHALLCAFDGLTGCPLLLNTSFNRAGEPIVCTTDDALAATAIGGVDLLAIEHLLVEGAEVGEMNPSRPLRLVTAWALAVAPLSVLIPKVHGESYLVALFALTAAVVAGVLVCEGRAASLSVSLSTSVAALVGLLLIDGVASTVGLTAGFIGSVIAALFADWLRQRGASPLSGRMVAAGFAAPLTVTAIYHHDGWLGVRNLSLLALAAILLAFLATGWIPLPGTRLPGPGVSVLVLPLVVLVAVMTRQRGVRLPTLLALGLLTAPIIALVRPRWWERLERRGLPLTRAVDGVFDVVGRALRPVESFLGRLFDGVASLISVVVLGFLWVPAVAVPSVVSRLLRWDPIWAPRAAGSAWIPLTAVDQQVHTMWSPEPAMASVLRRGQRKRRLRSGGILGFLVLQVPLAVVLSLPGADEPPPCGSDADPVLDGQPGWPQVGCEQTAVVSRALFDATAVYRWQDFDGRFVNMRGGVRSSWRPPECDCRRIRVWWFGGSAGWGWNQRDEHTIPSQIAKAAWGRGIALDVENRAMPGWTLGQGVRTFAQLITTERLPDVVMFYDGGNDVANQLTRNAEGRGADESQSSYAEVEVGDLLSDPMGKRDHRFGVPRSAPPNTPIESAAAVGGHAMNRYRRDVRLARLVADGLGVGAVFVWQPLLPTSPRSAGGPEALPEANRRVWNGALDSALAELPQEVINLADALDDVARPVYKDIFHTNEYGAKIVAEDLFRRTQPLFEGLAGAGPR